ncbi:NAD(P)-dependent oxidoreductase [Methylomonas paludis]|uniref:NAD(P)-dependent oxidoreductase n=1 Tax=Methylomonas paludis TaxID=1173101 RepID=A0A975R9C5_9GAMM|nr:NAD(P)-dependent oxidoreductase [Methylomonas paludis]QWF70041.1 NAD(P)-dependent oxidoreductase [Methylomonas paludis]
MNEISKRILITGGSGFIGTNLIEVLKQGDSELLNIDIKPPLNANQNDIYKNVDIRDYASLSAVINEFNPTQIYHLGARTDLNGPDLEAYDTNTDGVLNLIKAVENSSSVKRVIYTSSRLVCRIGYKPKSDDDYCSTTPYGESKVIGEKYVKESAYQNYEWSIVRPTSIWGPWFGLPYSQFFDMVRQKKYVHPKGKKINKSFGFVGNTVYQLISIMNAESEKINHKTFYVGDYQPIEVNEFANKICRAFNISSILTVPGSLLRAFAITGDFLKFIGIKNPPLTSFRLNNLLTEMVHDFGALPNITGPLPYSADDGIKITVEWILNSEKHK